MDVNGLVRAGPCRIKAAWLAGALILAPQAAVACLPDDGVAYDTLAEPGAFVAVAEISALAIREMDQGGSCLDVDYRREDMILGAVGATFRAEICSPDEAFTLDDLDGSADEFGFATGAKVLVGALPSETGGLRLAVPNCWGPFQVRLDQMGQAEQEAFLTEIREMLEDAP